MDRDGRKKEKRKHNLLRSGIVNDVPAHLKRPATVTILVVQYKQSKNHKIKETLS